MKIAEGIDMLTLEVQAFGQRSLIHPTLLWDSEGAVLVDAGMPGQLEAIRTEVTGVGIRPSSLKTLLITHQDIDHCGSAADLQELWGQPIRTYAHELDAPYLDGTKHPIKMDLRQSLQRLLQFPIERIVCYHGGLCDDNAQEQLRQLVAAL
jgi:glyoxylase-like metal-dependent hydrolase (beta-lactamase superfamily II)